MKKYLILICLTIFILAISGCKTSKPLVINFRLTWDQYSGRGETIYNVIQTFNEENPSIEVRLVGGNENRDDISSDLSQDSLDIYMMPYRYLQDKAISDQLLSLEAFFSNIEDEYEGQMLDLAMYYDDLKGIPWIGHSMSLVFNKDLTVAAQVNPYQFKSLEDLLEACQLVEAETGASGFGMVGADHHDITWMVNQFIYTYGGQLMEDGQVKLLSDETLEALDFYKNKLGVYGQPGWTQHSGVDVMEAFARGEIAFEIQGPWGVTDIWKREESFEVGVIPLDQMGLYSEIGPIMLSIAKESKHQEEAIQFIQFMLSDSSLEQVLKGEYIPKKDAYYPFRIPIKKSLENSNFYNLYPEFSAFKEGFKLASISTPSPVWAQEYQLLYQMNLHRYMVGDINAEEALKEIIQ